MSTLSEVAKRAGVSKTTASRVLNNRPFGIPISEETRKKVLKAAKELNYYPNIFARSLRTKKSGIVGVVVSDITDPYFSDIISGIEQVLKDLKSTMALFAFNDMTAIGSIRAIRDSGLHVPEDISVVGFDGIPIAAHYDLP